MKDKMLEFIKYLYPTDEIYMLQKGFFCAKLIKSKSIF